MGLLKRLLALGMLLFAGPLYAQVDAIHPQFVGAGGDFPITTRITQVAIGQGGVEVQFDKRDGPNRWPDNTTPGWGGPLEYSLGLAIKINGEWFASAPIETWNGNNIIGGPIQHTDAPTCANGAGQVRCNWFYDARWEPLNHAVIHAGDLLGIFVVAGDVRSNFNPVRERSNIVTFNMPAQGDDAAFDYPAEVVPIDEPPPVVVPPVVAPPVIVVPPPTTGGGPIAEPPVVVVPSTPAPIVVTPIDPVAAGAWFKGLHWWQSIVVGVVGALYLYGHKK